LKSYRSFTLLAFVWVGPCLSSSSRAASLPETTTHTAGQSLRSRVPWVFEANYGQADIQARFIGRSTSGTIFLTRDGAVLAAPGSHASAVRMRFAKASGKMPSGEAATGGVANYYRGRDPKEWMTQIPLFARVRYQGIYRGVDAVFHGHDGDLEYDFEVAPGGVPEAIVLAFDGADRVLPAPGGAVAIEVHGQRWSLLPPAAYQMRGGIRHKVETSYRILGESKVGLRFGDYDRSAQLVIDPVVQYAGIVGLNNDTTVKGMQVDSQGNVFLAGTTFASDFPVVNGQPGKFPAGTEQVFVTKLNAAGDTILFSTYIPCSGFSQVRAFVLDPSGNAYLTGVPGGSDFPVTLTALGTSGNYLVKFGPSGTMTYSTLLGGAFPDGLVADAAGNVLMTGGADPTLPTANAFQASPPCSTCGAPFFAKVNPTGTAYVFASYFYDPATAVANSASRVPGIALDGSGNIYLAGHGPAPLANPWQIGGGLFVAKLSPDAQTLLFATDFGNDSATLTAMAVGTDGTIYLVGNNTANDYPYTLNAAGLPVPPGGARGIFATAINPSLNGLTYSVYVGEGPANAMFLGANNHLYVAGLSVIGLLPLQNALVSDVSSGGFLAELDASGQPVQVSQFGGHLSQEIPTAIAADSSGNIFVAGTTSPQNEVPQPDPIELGPVLAAGLTGGNYGLFFAKISPSNQPQISLNTRPPFLFLRNAGSADLHIGSITFSGGKSGGNCGSVVPAGTSCVLTVSDNNGGLAAGTVSISSDAQPNVQNFNVSLFPNQQPGTPIGDFIWFEDVNPSLPPRTEQTVSLRMWNVGMTSATINLITTSQGSSQTNDCPSTLTAGATCSVQVAVSAGVTATLSVFIDNGFQKTFSFFPPPLSQNLLLSITGIAFPLQRVGGVALPRVISVTNVTNADAPLAPPALTGDPEFSIAGNNCPAVTPAHQTCAVAVQFNPLIDGKRNALLSLGNGTVQLFAQGEIVSSVQVSPLQLDFFPEVVHFGSFTFPVTLTNTLAAPASITGISFSLPDYSETDNCAGQVPAKGTCTIQVKFAPQVLGQRNGTMTVSFAGGPVTQILTLTGTAVTPFLVTPSSLSFTAGVGTTSPPQFVSIGNRLPTSLAYTFAVSGDFAISQNPCPSPMPPNIGCAPTLVFQPKVAGPALGSFTVSYAGFPEQDVVTLKGTASAVQVNPLQLTFPTTTIAQSTTQNVTLTNTGASPIGIVSIVSSFPDFSEADACNGQVPGNGSCTLHVTFAPHLDGSLNGSLSVAVSDGAQFVISLSGTGTGPVIAITATSVAFPDHVVGTVSSNAVSINVINNGDAPLNIAGISASGDFSQTNNCPASLLSTCTITVKFAPTAVGHRTGKLMITDNGFASPQQIPLAGDGDDFQIAVGSGPTTVTVRAGQPATYNLNLSAISGFSGFISFDCSGAPPLGSCSLSIPSTNLIGTVPVPLTVTVTTTPPTTTVAVFPRLPGLGGWNFCALVVILFLIASARLRRTVTVRGAFAVLLLCGLLAVGCGGGGSSTGGGKQVGGTPPGTYTIILTATDQGVNGPVSRKQNLTLVVQ
jgi:hypothetical protein